MKSSRCLTVILASLFLLSCSAITHQQHEDLELAQREAGRRLAYQAEELRAQRQQLTHLQTRNSELTEALFDLRQELELFKHNNHKNLSNGNNSRSRNKEKSADAASAEFVPQLDESGKVILGRAEWVWFDVLGRSVQARVDDKARSSSIHTDELQLFERDGEQWVRFSLARSAASDEKSGSFYEAPLLRKVRIRPAGVEEAESRPVVRLRIKVGDLIDSTEFTLVNRDTANFPVALGRSFLRDIAVVDEKRQYTQRAHSENSSL
jgi:hypothetical protein